MFNRVRKWLAVQGDSNGINAKIAERYTRGSSCSSDRIGQATRPGHYSLYDSSDFYECATQGIGDDAEECDVPAAQL